MQHIIVKSLCCAGCRLFTSAFIAIPSSHLIATSSAECVFAGTIMKLAYWTLVCVTLSGDLPTSHLSEDARLHLCRFAAQRPWPVWKWFSALHVRRGRSKPGCWIVRSVTSDWLTTVADSEESHSASFRLMLCQLDVLASHRLVQSE